MLETFKVRLKAKFPDIKFSDKRLNALAEKLNKRFPDITDATEHDTHIDGVYDAEDLAEFVRLDEIAEKPAAVTTTTTVTATDDKKTEIEKLTELVTGLATTVQTLTAEKTAQTKKATLKAKFEEKKVPEKFWSKMQHPEKEEDFDAFVETITKDYEELIPVQQDTYVPGRGSGGTKGGQKLNEKLINNLVDQTMGIQPQINTN